MRKRALITRRANLKNGQERRRVGFREVGRQRTGSFRQVYGDAD